MIAPSSAAGRQGTEQVWSQNSRKTRREWTPAGEGRVGTHVAHDADPSPKCLRAPAKPATCSE